MWGPHRLCQAHLFSHTFCCSSSSICPHSPLKDVFTKQDLIPSGLEGFLSTLHPGDCSLETYLELWRKKTIPGRLYFSKNFKVILIHISIKKVMRGFSLIGNFDDTGMGALAAAVLQGLPWCKPSRMSSLTLP